MRLSRCMSVLKSEWKDDVLLGDEGCDEAGGREDEFDVEVLEHEQLIVGEWDMNRCLGRGVL